LELTVLRWVSTVVDVVVTEEEEEEEVVLVEEEEEGEVLEDLLLKVLQTTLKVNSSALLFIQA
jgi:hypothetical protein